MGIRTKGEEVRRLSKLTSIWLILLVVWTMATDNNVHATEQSVHTISTEKELRQFCKTINDINLNTWNSESLMDFREARFVLTDDIKLSDEWIPIGLDNSSCFKGSFDGNGHTITNMVIDEYFETSGFFGYLDGSIEDLTIEGSNLSNGPNCGGIVGTLSNDGSVTNCTASVNIKGIDKIGGIVGNNEGGKIDSCINKGNIHGSHKVGGVVGENWNGTIKKCVNKGHIKSTRRGVATYGTGGIAGRSLSSDSIISESLNLGDINSNTEATGGIVGFINGAGTIVTKSYNDGLITINLKSSDEEITPSYSGGIVGIAGSGSVNITGCYNSGTIKNADNYGGIIGKYINENNFLSKDGDISNNYYLNSEYNKAIGLLKDKKHDNLTKAGYGVTAGNLNKLLLKWQASTGMYLEEEEFPQYTTSYGQMIIQLLYPNKITTKAFITYMEAQDKLNLEKDRN